MARIDNMGGNGLLCSLPNFPARFYREKYPTKGSKEVASSVASVLQESGFNVQPVSLGLDHGVWKCFKIGTQDILHTSSGCFLLASYKIGFLR